MSKGSSISWGMCEYIRLSFGASLVLVTLTGKTTKLVETIVKRSIKVVCLQKPLDDLVKMLGDWNYWL